MHLVTGLFRPALERAFRDTFGRLRSADPLAPIAVVAPSQRLANRLKELALEAVPGGFAGVRFFNLFTFARALYDEAAPDARVILDTLLPAGIVRSILKRHFKGERYLGRAGTAPGPLVGALHELKAGGVRPDDALTMLAFEDLGYEDAPKLAEILSLYKRYSEELVRRRIHVRADVVRAAADHAPKSKWLGSLNHVLYYGFYELDQNQLDLLREVVRRVDTTVFFPHVDARDYAFSTDFLGSIVAPMATSREKAAGTPRPARVSQIAASGAIDEAREAAKEVLRLADRGIPVHEIGVVARTLDGYAGVLEAAFREHRIPFTSSARRRVDRDPAVKATRLLFSIDAFRRADVIDLLRSTSFRKPGGDPDAWDRASRLMGIGHGADEWRRRLGERAGKEWVYREGERAARKEIVFPREEIDAFWGCVEALLDAPPAPKGWGAFAAWARDRVERFLEPDDRVFGVIDAIAELEGLAFEDPRATMLELLGGLTEPLGGETGVQVLDAMAARGLSFRALVVIGMNERVFPRFVLEDPFVRDSVRSRLEHRLGCRMPRKVEGYEEERLLFSLLMGSSPEIVLLHQRSDEKGRLQIASQLLPKGKPRQVPRHPAKRLRETPLDLLTPREAALRTGQAEALGRARGMDVAPLVQAQAFLKAVESRGPLTPFDGLVEGSTYFHKVAGHGFSPTALERLSECAFKFFAAGMMGLEELEEPGEEGALTPIEIGTVYHDVLEKVHGEGVPLARALEEAVGGIAASRTLRYPVLADIQKREILGNLKAFLAADAIHEFTPAAFEEELKAELPIPVAGRKTVTFRGYVDRLDRAKGGAFRAVDYKKSRGKYRYKMETGVFRHGWLQAPLYFLLTEKRLGKIDRERSRFVYYFLEEAAQGEKWQLELDGDFWSREEEFLGMLRELLETIAEGRFAIHPGDACRRCDLGTMCRKSHLPTTWRADEARRS